MKTETVKPENTQSLTTTLAISFFSLSVLVLLISSSLQIILSIQAQQTEIKEKQQLIAQDAGKSVSNFIEGKFNTMETAANFSSLATASYEDRIIALNGILGIDPAFEQINMFNSGAFQQAYVSRSSPTPTSQFASQLNGGIFAALSLGQRYYISPVYIDENTAEPLITLALPYRTVLGDYQGLLVTEVSMKFIWDLVDQIKVGETGYVYVVDNQGNLIAYKDTSRVLQGENVSQISEVSEFLKNPSAITDLTPEIQSYTGLNGDIVLGTYVPLVSPQWAVVIELPRNEAYQNVITLALRSIALILIIAILASLVGYLGARRTSAPLIDLSNVATEIARGNLSAQAREIGPTELVQLASSFNNMTSQLRDSIGNLERRVAERTADVEMARLLSEKRAQELQAISEISRTISTEQRLDILLPLVTRLASEKFDFYHVGIFFVDETQQFAVLQASNSEGGKRMVERGHRLEVGQTGIVGNVAQTGKPRIALDVGSDAVFFNNPDLPDTRSEMALPLKVRGQTIGVLDVQSIRPGAFSESDANNFSILADQVAISIDNARLFGKSQEALSELQRLYRQYQSQEWSVFSRQETGIGYHQSLIGGKSLDIPVESDEIQEALQKGKVIVIDGNLEKSQPSIAIPVKLRGQTIGVLQIKSPTKNHRWNQDEINLVQAISDRLGLALDNARLLQDSQRRAAKETKIGEVTAKIGASINMRSVLQTAVEQLGRALPGSEVVIQFKDADGEKPR